MGILTIQKANTRSLKISDKLPDALNLFCRYGHGVTAWHVRFDNLQLHVFQDTPHPVRTVHIRTCHTRTWVLYQLETKRCKYKIITMKIVEH